MIEYSLDGYAGIRRGIIDHVRVETPMRRRMTHREFAIFVIFRLLTLNKGPKRGLVTGTMEELAEITGCERRTFRRSVSELVAKGYLIEVERQTNQAQRSTFQIARFDDPARTKTPESPGQYRPDDDIRPDTEDRPTDVSDRASDDSDRASDVSGRATAVAPSKQETYTTGKRSVNGSETVKGNGGSFRLDLAVAEFRGAYRLFNPQGLESPKVEVAYADIVAAMPNPEAEHQKVLAGIQRMIAAKPKGKLGAQNFILDKRYVDPWDPKDVLQAEPEKTSAVEMTPAESFAADCRRIEAMRRRDGLI